MKAILIPPDTRPHTLDLPLKIAKIMDINVNVPPMENLPYFNTPGKIYGLHKWLKDTLITSSASVLIVNLETLTLGGMIPARRSDDSESEVLERLKILEEIHTAYI